MEITSSSSRIWVNPTRSKLLVRPTDISDTRIMAHRFAPYKGMLEIFDDVSVLHKLDGC